MIGDDKKMMMIVCKRCQFFDEYSIKIVLRWIKKNVDVQNKLKWKKKYLEQFKSEKKCECVSSLRPSIEDWFVGAVGITLIS